MVLVKHLAAILALAPLLVAQTGSVEGRILNTATGAGIGGVGIRLIDSQRTVFAATTDDTGAFRIGGLKDGQYLMSYEKDGYLHTGSGPADSRIRISGAEPLRFDGQLSTFPTLRGRVIGVDGKPAAGIHVQLLTSTLDAVTDSDGVFIFAKALPGSFTLVARPNPPPAGSKAQPDAERIEPVQTYYPSVIESSQAEAIQIRGGQDLFGYEIRMRTAPVQRIRGVVLGLDGKPVAKTQVSLLTPPTGAPFLMRGAVPIMTTQQTFFPEQTTQTGADGSFEFSTRRGDWQLRATSPTSYDYQAHADVMRIGNTSVSVGNHDVDRVEIRFLEPIDLEFSEDYGQSAPPPKSRPLVQLLPLEGQVALAGAKGPRWFPGRAIVTVLQSPPGFYPAAVLWGGRDVLGQEVNLTGPQTVQAVYKSDGGKVSGKIENGANLIIALIPQEASPLKMAISGRCDAGGSFSIADIPPGDYYAIALPSAAGIETAAFKTFLPANGTRIKVEPSASATLELHPARWP